MIKVCDDKSKNVVNYVMPFTVDDPCNDNDKRKFTDFDAVLPEMIYKAFDNGYGKIKDSIGDDNPYISAFLSCYSDTRSFFVEKGSCFTPDEWLKIYNGLFILTEDNTIDFNIDALNDFMPKCLATYYFVLDTPNLSIYDSDDSKKKYKNRIIKLLRKQFISNPVAVKYQNEMDNIRFELEDMIEENGQDKDTEILHSIKTLCILATIFKLNEFKFNYSPQNEKFIKYLIANADNIDSVIGKMSRNMILSISSFVYDNITDSINE